MFKGFQGSHILIWLLGLIIVSSFIYSRPWEWMYQKEDLLGSYKLERKGIVQKFRLYKGCGLKIEFYDKNRKYLSIKKDTSTIFLGNGCDLLEIINKGDYLQKLADSDKCFIVRNDNIFFFDCDDEYLNWTLKDTVFKISRWPSYQKYRWRKLTDNVIDQYLQNDKYREYKENQLKR